MVRAALVASACVLAAALLGGCTTLERAAHLHSSASSTGKAFALPDGASLFYYTHYTSDPADPLVGAAHGARGTETSTPVAASTPEQAPSPARSPGITPASNTILFLIGGSGCTSWKASIPNYVAGFGRTATVYAVNKRHTPDDSLGVPTCSRAFHEHNHIAQWVSDYRLLIDALLAQLPPASTARPRQLVLIGASEGALPAMQLAATHPAVTHLALIGFGGWSIRRSMQYLFDHQRGNGTNPADLQKAIERAPASLSDEINGDPYRSWRGVFNFDPMPLLKTLSIPVIVGMGEADASIPSESARDLVRQFSAAGKRNAYVHIYPSANHVLNAAGRSYHSDFFGELALCTAGNCTYTMP